MSNTLTGGGGGGGGGGFFSYSTILYVFQRVCFSEREQASEFALCLTDLRMRSFDVWIDLSERGLLYILPALSHIKRESALFICMHIHIYMS